MAESVGEFLGAYNLCAPLAQRRVVNEWALIMGDTVARRTTGLDLKGSVLQVRMSSAPLRHQLTSNQARVLELIAAHVGQGVVSEVRFR